jgi:hypothetical protein
MRKAIQNRRSTLFQLDQALNQLALFASRRTAWKYKPNIRRPGDLDLPE